MMNKKQITFVTSLLFSVIYIPAQTSDFRVDPQDVQRSPQVADMMRFGNIPVAMNSGRLDLSIPVITLRDPDFDITIGLSYNSSGFMPMKNDGYIGLNWSLTGLGMITREVIGMPDDLIVKPRFTFAGHESDQYGFLKIAKNKSFQSNDLVLNDYINQPQWVYFENTPNILVSVPNGKKKALVDACSDIYHFNFGKHAGKFMLNYDGTVNVVSYSGGSYQVDISGWDFPNITSGFGGGATIKIITDDGYVYQFGGSVSNVEYHIASWHNEDITNTSGLQRTMQDFNPFISTYYLSKITAPNKRELTINYMATPSEFYGGNKYAYLAMSGGLQNFKTFSSTCSLAEFGEIGGIIGNASQPVRSYVMHSLNKIALVNSISTENASIEFQYSTYRKSYMETGGWSIHLDKVEKESAQLDKISYYDYNTNSYLESCDLTYKIWGDSYPRRLLSKITLNEDENYSFHYYDEYSPPSPFTNSLDYWNYWNGYSDRKDNLLPEFDLNYATDDLLYTDHKREPSGRSIKTGMLSNIGYPTGGATEIEYEQHDYSQILARRSDNNFLPKLYPENKQAGGIRVKRLINISNFGNREVVEYIYKKEIDGSRSSGILHYKPRYYELIKYTVQDNTYSCLDGEQIILKTSNAGFDVNSYEKDHITYSSVIEIRRRYENLPHNGYTITDFSDYNSNPDILYDYNYMNPNYMTDHNDFYSINFSRDLIDMSHTRGKIARQRIYDEHSKLLKDIAYRYKYLPNNFDKFNLYVKKAPAAATVKYDYKTHKILYSKTWIGGFRTNKVYLYPSLLQEKKVVDYIYNGGIKADSLISRECFLYDSNHYLKEYVKSAIENQDVIKIYSRSYELGLDAFMLMSEMNILSPIIEELTLLRKNEEDKFLSRVFRIYKINGDDPSNFLPVVELEVAAMGENRPEIRTVYPEYDDYGNPLSVIKDGYSTAYLWAYSGRYMIAKIENASFAQVRDAVNNIWGWESPKEMSRVKNINASQLNQLYTQASLKDALITTYIYNSAYGMTSSTDPSEKTTFYDYDSKGRLKSIYLQENGVKQIIESYDYKYVNQ